MGRWRRLMAPLGALAVGLLLMLGIAGSLIRLPPKLPCVVDADRSAVQLRGTVADLRRQVSAAVNAPTGHERARASGDQPAVRPKALREALASGPVLTCRIAPIAATHEPKVLPLGLTPRARELRATVREVFGKIPDGGFGPQKVLPGRAAGGEHSLGRAVDFFFRPPGDADQVQRGWLLANWAVANAQRLRIRTVIYSDHIWTARRSSQGWRHYRFGGSNPESLVNRHLDHVHIDVA